MLVVSGVRVQAQQAAVQPDAAKPAASDVRTQRFGDWALQCVLPTKSGRSPVARATCEIGKPIAVERENNYIEVLNLAISRAKDKALKVDWALVVLAPPDVHLASDFGFAIGKAKPTMMRYRNCNSLGCFAVLPLDKKRINQLKRGAKGTASFRLLDGQAVKISFSLMGFTKAFDALAAGTVPAAKRPNVPANFLSPDFEKSFVKGVNVGVTKGFRSGFIKAAPKAAVKAAPKAATKAAPKAAAKAAPKAAAKAAPKAAARAAPKAAAKAAPKAAAKAAPKAAAKAAPKAAARAAPKAAARAAPKAAAKAATKAAAKAAPKAVSKDTSRLAPKDASRLAPKPAVRPAPKAAPRPAPRSAGR